MADSLITFATEAIQVLFDRGYYMNDLPRALVYAETEHYTVAQVVEALRNIGLNEPCLTRKAICARANRAFGKPFTVQRDRDVARDKVVGALKLFLQSREGSERRICCAPNRIPRFLYQCIFFTRRGKRCRGKLLYGGHRDEKTGILISSGFICATHLTMIGVRRPRRNSDCDHKCP